MKRKLLCIVLVLSVLLSGLIGPTVSASAAEEPILSFVAVSDLHLDDLLYQTSNKNKSQFQDLMTAVSKQKLDLFVCGGDISSYGDTDVWYSAQETVRKTGIPNEIWAVGNHEYGTLGLNANVKKNFLAFAGRDSLWYATEVNGIPFIVLAVEDGIPGQYGSLSSEQISWLRTTLGQTAEKAEGKPIFVVTHIGTNSGKIGSQIGEILGQYDNVHLLWGHEHGSDVVSDSMSDYVFTAGGYTSARMGMIHYYNSANADGAIVRVYADRVEYSYLRVDGPEVSPGLMTVGNTYTVRFLDESGMLLKTEKVAAGEAATAPSVPEKPGKLAVWSTDFRKILRPQDVKLTYRDHWTAECADSALSVILPERDHLITLVAAAYDGSGKMTGCASLTVSPGKAEQVGLKMDRQQLIRIFVLNENYAPERDAITASIINT